MNINSRQIKAFIFVARFRNFSRAAEQLHMTQSGISLIVRELEQQLGFRLFDRTTRAVTLTAHGMAFLPVAQKNANELEKVISRIRNKASDADRLLSVGAAPLISADLLPMVIRDFGREFPRIKVRLVDSDRASIIGMVEAGDLDIGLGMFLKATTGVRRISILKSRLVAIRASNRNLRDSPRREVSWNDLKDEPMVALPLDNPLQKLIDSHRFRSGRKGSTDTVVNYLATQISMVEAGAGAAIVPVFVLHASQGRMVQSFSIIEPAVEINLYQIRNRGKKLSSAADGFMELLKKHIGAWPSK
ncbi:MAG: LysR family transcriptional regulator [Dongiaceae bacterium]